MQLSKRFFVFIFLTIFCATVLAQAETPHPAWKELPRPGGNDKKGLFLDPTLANMGSRIHMVWSGTSEEIRRPEVFHSSIDGGDDKWKDPRAPFFGMNKGRVRKLALGKTRNLIGLVFQRTLAQGNDAYEVLLSISADQGWSWSKTVEIDSYVSDATGGTAVAVEGREGSNRPEFTIAWARAFGDVRAANFDITSSLRPEGTAVGTHDSDAPKISVGTVGRDGFAVVFNNGAGLSTAHVKGLIGSIQEGTSLIRGRFGNFFSVASRPYGPARVVVGADTAIESLTSDGTKWKKDDESATLPFNARGVSAEADMDDDKNLHVAMIRPVDNAFELWYVGQKDKKWQTPEFIHSFDDKMDMRGFDIAASSKYIVIVASQGYDAKFFRREN